MLKLFVVHSKNTHKLSFKENKLYKEMRYEHEIILGTKNRKIFSVVIKKFMIMLKIFTFKDKIVIL